MAKRLTSTQQHLDIYDIKQGLVLLKNGGARLILSCTAVNFNLLSEIEQDAIIAAYSALLNSLSFPIQVVIRSKKMDISYFDKKEMLPTKKCINYLRRLVGEHTFFDDDYLRLQKRIIRH